MVVTLLAARVTVPLRSVFQQPASGVGAVEKGAGLKAKGQLGLITHSPVVGANETSTAPASEQEPRMVDF
jgi:hypothetical protein